MAERLLESHQVDVCLELCDEVEMLINEKKGPATGVDKQSLEKVQTIRRRLNAIMVREVRGR